MGNWLLFSNSPFLSLFFYHSTCLHSKLNMNTDCYAARDTGAKYPLVTMMSLCKCMREYWEATTILSLMIVLALFIVYAYSIDSIQLKLFKTPQICLFYSKLYYNVVIGELKYCNGWKTMCTHIFMLWKL